MTKYVGRTICRIKGKKLLVRVLDREGPRIETSVSVSGTIKGMQIQEMITFNGTPTTNKGVLHGVGKGVIMVAGE